MPYTTRIDCPDCGRPLIRKGGGRCSACGASISAHVARARLREKRIEQVTAAVATVLVLALFLWAGGAGLFEGILVYAAGGLAVWWWAKGTFWSRRLPADDEADDEAD